jgi:peroxiredoxin
MGRRSALGARLSALGCRLSALLVALAVLSVAAAAQDGAGAPRTAAELPEALARGDYGAADWRWMLRGLDDDRPQRLDAWRGRVLFVNLWATWCPPCTAELAGIQALHDSLATEPGVAFLVVSPERPGPVREFLRRRRHTFPAFVEATRLPAAFGLRALPTTFVIDREGRIVLAHRGAANWDTPRMRAYLRELAAGG